MKGCLGQGQNGTLLLRASLADAGPAVTALLDAIVALLTGAERRQQI
jgi:hypothetical protein